MQNEFNDLQLPYRIDIDYAYEGQPSFTEEQPIIIPELYFQEDYDFSTFIPLTDLTASHLSDNLNVTLIDKPELSELNETLCLPATDLDIIKDVNFIKEELVEIKPSVEVKVEPNIKDGFKFDQDDKVRTSVVNHIKVHKRRFKCTLCKYHAQKSDALKIHTKIFHNKEKQFTCGQCSFITSERSDFMCHLITHFKRDQDCDQCNYNTNSPLLMKLHMMTHNGQIPFTCDVCEYSTMFKRNLVEHMWIHAKERPFKCIQCDYVGLNSKSLSYHVAKKHKLGNI